MVTPNKERIAAYRDRQRQGVEVPTCKCARPLKGNLSRIRQLCTACYKKSPEGRHQNWAIKSRSYGNEPLVEEIDRWEGWEKGMVAIAPDGSVGTVVAIASWSNGAVTATIQFEDVQDSFIISSSNTIISH